MQGDHDPAIVTAVVAGLEASINRALSLAPATQKELSELAGITLAIECVAPRLEVFVTIEPDGQLALSGYSEADVATRVRGSMENFMALATAEDPAATLINSDLEIVGNTAPLIALQQCLASIDIDWEAPIVDVLGDVAGHQLANLLRGGFGWGREAGASLRRQLSEFILEEGRLSPPAAELEDFYLELGKLNLRVDRLHSRIQRLGRRISDHKQ